jgi:hypothetical protein
VGGNATAVTHEQTLAMAARLGEDLGRLLIAFLEGVSDADRR